MVNALRGKVPGRAMAAIITLTLLSDVTACIEQQAADSAAGSPTVTASSTPTPEPTATQTQTPTPEPTATEESAPAEAAPPAQEPEHVTHTEEPPAPPADPPYAGLTNDEVTQQLVHLYPQLETDGFDPYGCHAYGPVYTMTPDGSQIPPVPSLQGESDTYNSYHVWVDVNAGGKVQYYSCYHTA